MVRSNSPASRDPAGIARELASLSDAQLALRLAEPLPIEAGTLLAALRLEASRHYHSDAGEARRIAQRALTVARALGDPLSLGWARRTMAEALLFSGRVAEADAAYAEADRDWTRAGAGALRGQLLVARTHVLAMLGRMDEVAPTARAAARLLEAAGDRVYLAKLAMNLGSIHFQRDQHAEALAAYERAHELFRGLRVRDETVVGLDVNRAVALTQLERADEALALFARLERDCGRRGFDLLQAQVRMNVGYVHALRGDFDQALGRLGAATAYFRNTDHPAFLGNCLINRAEIYQQLNLHGEALEMCDEAAGHFQSAGLPYDRALALAQSAVTLLAAARPAEAMAPVRAAAALFRRERNPARVALMAYIGAEALARSGRGAAARRRAQGAVTVFRELGLIRWEAAAGALIQRLSAREDPAQRRRSLRDLVRRVPERVYPLQSLALLELLGEVEEQAGSPTRAARSYARAAARLEALRMRVPTEDSKIAFLRDKTHIFDRLLRIELDRERPRPGRLFEWMERARAQALWDRLRDPTHWSAASNRGAAGEQRRRLSWLHARVSRLELGTADERDHARGLRTELLRAERDFERTLRREREALRPRSGRRTPAAADRPPAGAAAARGPSVPPRSGIDGIDLAELTRALPAGHGFLSYHVGPDFAFAAGATPAGPFWCRLAPDLADRLAPLVARLDFQWSAATLASVRRSQLVREAQAAPAALAGPAGAASDAFLRAATDEILAGLHDLLWQPLEKLGLPGGIGWIVSPHGALHRIPMHALRGPHGYLVDRGPLQLAPSARVWREVARRRPRGTGPRRAYLAALPSATLPAVEGEVMRVRGQLKGWDVLVDLKPTRAALEREAARASVVHIAAHGELRADNPSFSCIHLADGPLFVHDLGTLRLAGAVVVLTACSSGRGTAPAGDEWIGLARGFLQAGASQVVASLWSIEDEATGDLMEGFYAGLAAELAPEEALRLAMIAQRLVRPHPWHWAPFAVLGGSAGARARIGAGGLELIESSHPRRRRRAERSPAQR